VLQPIYVLPVPKQSGPSIHIQGTRLEHSASRCSHHGTMRIGPCHFSYCCTRTLILVALPNLRRALSSLSSKALWLIVTCCWVYLPPLLVGDRSSAGRPRVLELRRVDSAHVGLKQ
jgi:hypothetical protein